MRLNECNASHVLFTRYRNCVLDFVEEFSAMKRHYCPPTFPFPILLSQFILDPYLDVQGSANVCLL